jgi:SHAQKYF class myb-like DNA-binding protein
MTKGRWTKEERIKFAFALYKFGTDWKKIKAHIKTRSFIQLRSHGQKFLAKLKTNKIIVEKGLNLDNYNWKESVDCLKENLSEEEFMNVLYSIESEIGDNNRMTERYLERKRLRLKMNLNRTEETLNTCFNSSDENNLNLFENKLKEDLQNNIDENNNHSNIIDLEEENNYKNNLYKYNFYVNKNLVSNIFKKELSKIDENIFNLEEDNLLYKSKSDTLKALYKL